jgi:hypothetical protein
MGAVLVTGISVPILDVCVGAVMTGVVSMLLGCADVEPSNERFPIEKL